MTTHTKLLPRSRVRPGLPTTIRSTLALRPFKDIILEHSKKTEGKKKAERAPHVFLFGRPHDWAGEEKTLGLEGFLTRKGITELYAPCPTTSNARIALKDEFTHRPRSIFTVGGEVKADGVVLDRTGQACIIKSADCPTIIAFTASYARRKCVVAHAGRDSLVDPHYTRGLGRSRSHKSVVDSIMAEFSTKDREELYVYSVLGIGAKHFSHPVDDDTYGRQNRELMEYIDGNYGVHCFFGPKNDGCINLHEVIKAQFDLYRNEANIFIANDRSETFNEPLAGPGTGFRWWSHRRGDSARNAVVVAF